MTVWRTAIGILVFLGDRFVHIDAMGAIVATYGYESLGLSARSFYIEGTTLWSQLEIATIDDIEPEIVLEGLVREMDPDAHRFAEIALGDAAVTAEALAAAAAPAPAPTVEGTEPQQAPSPDPPTSVDRGGRLDPPED